MSTARPSAPPKPQPVEAVILHEPVQGLRNPPCCGRACVPKIHRTKIVGQTRVADASCPLCGHTLRITYELRQGDDLHGSTWTPIAAQDLNRCPA